MKHVAILDFGSQYTHLIARNIRELNVLSKIYHHDVSAEELKKEEAIGVIFSGGPQFISDGESSIKVDSAIFELDVPILGLCYGHQLIAHMLGGEVKPGEVREYGRANLRLKNKSKITENISEASQVWMSHGDTVMKIPEGFSIIAETSDCPVAIMANDQRDIYSFQFHPEVVHTEEGTEFLKNFVLNICKAEQNWKIDDIISDLTEKIKIQTEGKKVFVLCSGGVDSNVAFALLTKALGKDRVLGLYIDTGFMRMNESEEIMENFKKIGFDNIKSIDASQKYFERLREIYDPEKKRHIIGQTFLDVKDDIVKDLGLNSDEWLLGQGTIYPDTIESGATKNADKIKTHHNRVDAIQKLIAEGKVIEPLVDFYKDEVRNIGKLLGLSDELIKRHPFPGPGLAIMTLCYNTDSPKDDLEDIEHKVDDLYKTNYKDVKYKLLPIKSVGVQGDNRTYAHPLAIWGNENWEELDKISSNTTNTIKGINRVILLLNNSNKTEFNFKLPVKSAYLTPDRVNVTRIANDIVYRNIREAGIYDEIWEFPVVQIPITDNQGRESIVLRPFNSRDVMTLHFYHMNKNILEKITREILAIGKVSYVFYDITNKPPGTVQWE